MLEYLNQRNRDFIEAVNRVLRDGRHLKKSLRECVELAAESPAPEYYVTYSHVMARLPGRGSGRLPVSGKTRRSAMWREIIGRADEICERTGCRRTEAVARVLADGNASSFFLTPSTAWVLYHEIMSGRTANPVGRTRRPRRPRLQSGLMAQV